MNRFIGIGNLTRDPEMRYTPTGKAVASFSIAINEGRGERKTVEFLNCIAWEKLAEVVAEYARKGRKIAVEGRLTTESWTDKTSGQKRYATRIRCSNVEFLDRGEQKPTAGNPDPEEREEEDLSDLPF